MPHNSQWSGGPAAVYCEAKISYPSQLIPSDPHPCEQQDIDYLCLCAGLY